MVSVNITHIKSYILSGRLLHIITLIELIMIIFLLPIILEIKTNGSLGLILLKSYLICYIISLPVFAQLDARSRYQNYKQIKDQLYLYGYSQRLLKPVLKSRCQRDAALTSAMELGISHQCSEIFKGHGYRWYHILPDFIFKKPQFLITKYFWRTTFFAPTYKPKVDFSMIKKQDIRRHLKLETVNV